MTQREFADAYLKKDGVFVFGWPYPIHKCVSVENGELIFDNSYFNEEWYCADMGDEKIMPSEETDREKAMGTGRSYQLCPSRGNRRNMKRLN